MEKVVRDIFGILVFGSLGFVIRLLPYLQERRLALQVLYSIYTRPRGSIIQRNIPPNLSLPSNLVSA
uniref:Uncharacterized protein n=1 Tax=Aegilops tauschii subsp. strangulata TaxID=200361 RepID=A0A453MJB1_AEGTS